jgi:hypothetical protein
METAEGWEKLHDEKLHNWYSSPYTIGVIETRMGWQGM